MKIPFNKPYMTGKELWYISQAHANGHLAGDGEFTRRCHAWLEERIGCSQALLTHSCTAALEMTAILADLKPGDEVVMPSYTFVSTANAFVLRGVAPVFVDIRPDTLNIDENRIEQAITDKTRAIVVMHYAGVACEMDTIMGIARRHGLLVIEDDAQGMGSKYKGRQLGNIGHMATLSFHETKNIISGEGGALLLNESRFNDRAEIIREKGTNRGQFFRGQVDKYTWVEIGSSYLPSDLVAAFLWAQMEEADAITQRRLDIWNTYHRGLASLEERGKLRRPIIPPECQHNAHMYYLLLPNLEQRTAFIQSMKARDIHTVFHYVPLHDSPMGQKYGRTSGDLSASRDLSERLVRLPLWLGIESELEGIIEQVVEAVDEITSAS
ncbi:dTDP-4-amino-4,6-dideoxygalactose transaminase [Gammaproteobacteria bacterium]|nr:dTDP-4-amino-4,6-dideoxygalactose transaminase [Gammaproteobacteria bacterium]